jgi:hypothetical protein
MSAQNGVHQPRHRILPFLTIGLAVLGLLVSVLLPGETAEGRLFLKKPLWTPKLVIGAVVTCPILCCALYVIVSHGYQEADKKWAYGAVGTLLGFWLGGG